MPLWSIIALLFAASTAFWLLAVPRLLAWRGVTIKRTMFGLAVIFDSADADGTPIRLLNVNGVYQSVAYVDEELRGELACLYHRVFAEALEASGARRVLVMGGGGFSLPRGLVERFPEMQVDVIEIDPAVIEIAREHFWLDELETAAGGRLRVICADAWAWLSENAERYDAIVNDAFSGKRSLGPMATDEGARIVREHLCEEGIYLANVRSALEGRRASNLDEAARAFASVFSDVVCVPDRPDAPRDLGYNALAAADRPLGLEGARELS